MYIVVTGQEHRMREVPAYLYHGQHVTAQPVETNYGSYALIVDTGSNDQYIGQYLRDRLASGMFGAVLFTSRNEADAYVKDMTT